MPEVGDVWLDAGIVPFSTLGWRNDEWVPEGYATGASRGLSKADLPDHAYWEQWFPADWVTEMREQIRLWFYSQFFMSIVLTGDAPYRKVLTYEKLQDAEGREMHGSWGNLISAEDAFERMGADVMRWQYCQQPPTQNLRFGYKAAGEIKRRLLTLWNSVRFLTDYGSIEGFAPCYADVVDGPPRILDLRPLDVWLLARVQQLVREAETAYDAYLTVDVARVVETFVEDLSNWYIRRSRRRFYTFDEAAFRTLWTALVQLVRVFAPIMPFLAEHLWQTLVADVVLRCARVGAPRGLAGGASSGSSTTSCSRRSRRRGGSPSSAGARGPRPGLKLRQPLRKVYVRGAPLSRVARRRDRRGAARQGGRLRRGPGRARRAAAEPARPRAAAGQEAAGGARRAEGRRLLDARRTAGCSSRARSSAPTTSSAARRSDLEGWAIAEDDGISVAFDVELDDELRTEGRVHDLVHELNVMRKEQGFELTDRIAVTLPERDADLMDHGDWIRAEVLALRDRRRRRRRRPGHRQALTAQLGDVTEGSAVSAPRGQEHRADDRSLAGMGRDLIVARYRRDPISTGPDGMAAALSRELGAILTQVPFEVPTLHRRLRVRA